MTNRIKGASGGFSFDPLPQMPTSIDLIKNRFKDWARKAYPQGLPMDQQGFDQWVDIIRCFMVGWHECLYHMNQVHGMKQPINDEILFWSINFNHIFSETFLPDQSWKWW